MFITNRGFSLLLQWALRGVALPTNFYAVLLADTITPTVDMKTMSQVAEIPAGNGYTSGGIQLSRNTTDFDTLTENDTTDLAEVLAKDLVFTASGGNLPASGSGARYAALTTDEAVVANRQLVAIWDLQSNRVVSTGQDITLQNAGVRLQQPA